jgi:tagaturonate reductase
MVLKNSTSQIAQVFYKLNTYLERTMPILTPSGVLLGFIFPSFFLPIRPYIPLLFGIMSFSGALNLRFKELVYTIKKPKAIILFFLFSHILMPCIALIAGILCNPGEPEVYTGFVLLFSTPTAVSGFMWNSIFKGDGALSLTLIVLDTILAPLVVPFTMKTLLGTTISFNMIGIALSLVEMVVIPTIFGIGINEISKGSVPPKISPYFTVLSKFCLFTVVAANTAAVAPTVNLGDIQVWSIAGQAVLLGLIGFSSGKFAGFIGKIEQTSIKTLVFSIGLRNITAAATLAITYFPEKAALPAILGMVFQQALASLAGRILLGPPASLQKATS